MSIGHDCEFRNVNVAMVQSWCELGANRERIDAITRGINDTNRTCVPRSDLRLSYLKVI